MGGRALSFSLPETTAVPPAFRQRLAGSCVPVSTGHWPGQELGLVLSTVTGQKTPAILQASGPQTVSHYPRWIGMQPHRSGAPKYKELLGLPLPVGSCSGAGGMPETRRENSVTMWDAGSYEKFIFNDKLVIYCFNLANAFIKINKWEYNPWATYFLY